MSARVKPEIHVKNKTRREYDLGSREDKDSTRALTKCRQATHPCDVFLLGSWDLCYCNFLRHSLLFLFDLASSTLKGQL